MRFLPDPLRGVAGPDGSISIHNQLGAKGPASEYQFKTVPAHEVFHEMQFAAVLPYAGWNDKFNNAEAIIESTPDHMALQVFPMPPSPPQGCYEGSLHTPCYNGGNFELMLRTPVDWQFPEYAMFPVWTAYHDLGRGDLVRDLFDPVDPLILAQAPGDTGRIFFHRMVRARFATPDEWREFWTAFAVHYQYTRNEISGIRDWLTPEFSQEPSAARLYGTERDEPAHVRKLEAQLVGSNYGSIPPGQLRTYVVDLEDVLCTPGPNCTGPARLADLSDPVLTLRLTAGSSVHGTIYSVPVTNGAGGPALRLDTITGGTNHEVGVPLSRLTQTTRVVLGLVYDPKIIEPDQEPELDIKVEAFFTSGAPRCQKVALSGDAAGIVKGRLYWWGRGAPSLAPTQIPLPSPAKCVAIGGVGGRWTIQVLTESGELWLYDMPNRTMMPGPFATQVAVIAANVYAKTDGSVWRYGWHRYWEARTVYLPPTSLMCAETGPSLTSSDDPPTPVPGVSDVVELESNPARDRVLARTRSGAIYFVGSNNGSVAGDGNVLALDGYPAVVPQPATRALVPSFAWGLAADLSGDWRGFANGEDHFSGSGFALLRSGGQGRVLAWGSTYGGRRDLPTCPQGTRFSGMRPSAVTRCTGIGIVAESDCVPNHLNCTDCVDDGPGRACCIDGSFVCAYHNSQSPAPPVWYVSEAYREADTEGVATPTPIAALDGTKRIFAHHAVLDSGAVVAWGLNDSGERGDGTFDSTCNMTQVSLPGELDSTAFIPGNTLYHVTSGATEILLASGTWSYGVLGDRQTPSAVPIEVWRGQ